MTDIKEHIVNEALNIVTGARRRAYGTPENNFARICTIWMAYFTIKGWELRRIGDDVPEELAPLDVAAMMRLMKEARLAETPDHLDSYQDIVGYTLCGAECAGVAVPTTAATQSEHEAYRNIISKLEAQINYLRSMHASADLTAASSQDDQASGSVPAP